MTEKILSNHKLHNQMSESQYVMFFITISGGLQDAYTYWMRGGVFANAQTGNIVLLTGYLFHGKWTMALHYLIPVMAFSLGIILAEQIHGRLINVTRIHWRQIILLIEIILLTASSLLPEEGNVIANALISLTCAMQVESFRKVNGYGYASTMCIGNLRNAMSSLSQWFRSKEKEYFDTFIQYMKVIGCFAFGAFLGTTLPVVFHLQTILLSSFLLIIAFFLMFQPD